MKRVIEKHVCDGCEMNMPEPPSKFMKIPKGWRYLEFVGPTGQRKDDPIELCPNCTETIRTLINELLARGGKP